MFPQTRRIIAIVDRRLSPLMKILGIDEVIEVGNVDEVKSILVNIVKRNDIGVIIVQQSLSRVIDIPLEGMYPIVISIPDTIENAKMEPIEIYRSIMRKFIGYEIYI